MDRHNDTYELTIKDEDGTTTKWETISPESEYDAIHAAAGALLAGAKSISIVRSRETSPPNRDIEIAKDRVRQLAEEIESDLTREEILSELSHTNSSKNAQTLFEQLRKRGEIYNPRDNIWKVT